MMILGRLSVNVLPYDLLTFATVSRRAEHSKPSDSRSISFVISDNDKRAMGADASSAHPPASSASESDEDPN